VGINGVSFEESITVSIMGSLFNILFFSILIYLINI
jgi:Na+-transporting methylmalonyl-CoA/oxaloacetate decarboxylase gamma subunit